MVRRYYTLILDIAVDVEDFRNTTSRVAGSQAGKLVSTNDQDVEWRARQARLYDSIISQSEVLEDLCRCYAIDSLEDNLTQDLRKRFDVKEDEEVVLPAISSLSKSDQKYWQRVLSAGLFPENSELISGRIQTRLLSAQIRRVDAAGHSR